MREGVFLSLRPLGREIAFSGADVVSKRSLTHPKNQVRELSYPVPMLKVEVENQEDLQIWHPPLQPPVFSRAPGFFSLIIERDRPDLGNRSSLVL
jgi:hypothetical protein